IDPVYIVTACWGPLVVVLLMYITKLMKQIKEYKLKIYGFFIGFFAFGLGYAGSIDMMVESFGYFSRFLGDIFMLLGISLISFVFVQLPSLKEVDWAKKLERIVLMHKSGTCICDYNFLDVSSKVDSDQVSQYMAGSLIGISQMITELIQGKKQLEVMDHQDKQIIFSYGESLIAALIVDEYYEIYRKKLTKFIDALEVIYQPFLEDWEGNLLQVKPIEKLIKRIFS
ncbi:MAG: hypothetical protein HWN66_13790, partial [Candidatus Helarchaeota archaeon]|nr:hypothetical protein [Candidatus Helarchaeota archaeon]